MVVAHFKNGLLCCNDLQVPNLSMSTAAETSFSCQNAAQKKEKETEKKMHLAEKQMLLKKRKKMLPEEEEKVLPNRKENTTPIVYLFGQVRRSTRNSSVDAIKALSGNKWLRLLKMIARVQATTNREN